MKNQTDKRKIKDFEAMADKPCSVADIKRIGMSLNNRGHEMENEKRNFDEFHRGYTSGAQVAAKEIIQHVQTPIEYKEDLTERVMQVLRDEMDIDLMADRDCSDCGERSGCEAGQVFCRWPCNIRVKGE